MTTANDGTVSAGICVACGTGKLGYHLVPSYPIDQLGLDGVVLLNAVRRYRCGDEACGVAVEGNGVLIPNFPGLIAAVAITRAKLPEKLIGKEIKFLRKALKLTARELAETVLNVKPETISRWENDVLVIPPAEEKVLRIAVGTQLQKLAPLAAVGFDPSAIATMKFEPMRRPGSLHFVAVPADVQVSNPEDARNYVQAAA